MRQAESKELSAIRSQIMASEYSDKVQCALLTGETPVLSVSPLAWHPCLPPDRSLARMNIKYVNNTDDGADRALSVSLLAYNNRSVAPAKLEADSEDVLDALSDLLRLCATMTPCTGFRDDLPEGQVFASMRKADFSRILVEPREADDDQEEAGVLYRSRKCLFFFPKEDGHDFGVCLECWALFTELDSKYCSGKFTASMSDKQVEKEEFVAKAEPESETEVDQGPRRAVRRRGIKMKKVLVEKHVCKEERLELEEGGDMKNMELSQADSMVECGDPDFSLRRSGRKRKPSSLLPLHGSKAKSKQRRGRPPIMLTVPLACDKCGQAFTMAKEYRIHCLSHTNTFACEEKGCDKLFKTQEDLDIHVRRHRGQVPFPCSHCKLAFKKRSELRAHLQKHTGVKPFPCPECPKSFARGQQLAIHMAVHTGEKPFLCPECGDCFASASTLIDHKKRKHLDKRDFKCPECPKAFFARQDLESHKRTHTGDKPFQCIHCGKAFNRTHHLKRHMQSIHHGLGPKPASNSTNSQQLGQIMVDGAVLKLAEGLEKGTLLVTTDDDQTVLLGDTEYLVDGHTYVTSIASDGTPLLIQKMEDRDEETGDSDDAGDQLKKSRLECGDEAASSLIALSKARVDGKSKTDVSSSCPNDEISMSADTVVVELPDGSEVVSGQQLIMVTADTAEVDDSSGNVVVGHKIVAVEEDLAVQSSKKASFSKK